MDNRDIITKLEFNDLQLKQIQLGLKEDLDISKYADPKFDYSQMDEIRIRLVLIEEIKAQEREIEW